MTDKEMVVSLLRRLGVGFEDIDDGKTLKCTEGMDKVSGYNMFFTTFEFDGDGKFLQMGAWE